MTFIEEKHFHNRRRNITVCELQPLYFNVTELWLHLLKGKLFSDKRRKLFVDEKHLVDFLGTEFWWYLLNESSSTIRKGVWPFTKALIRFYWHEVLISFTEMESFHDKRRNLTVDEKLHVHFIGRKSWWNLLNESFSTIREGIWPFTKNSHTILLARSRDGIYWRVALSR
jgi:hypothetical protein